MRKIKRNEAIAIFIVAPLVLALFALANVVRLPQDSTGLGFTQQQAAGVSEVLDALEKENLLVNDLVIGSGKQATAGKRLSVHYTGQLIDGTVFDSSRDRGVPFQFVLGAGSVIKGWDRGVVGMREGGTRTLMISPELGYGDNQVGSIPPNSILIFEVELLEVGE